MVSVLGNYIAYVDLRLNYMSCCGLDFVSTAGYATVGYVLVVLYEALPVTLYYSDAIISGRR